MTSAQADYPAWSLCIELAAMPFMPWLLAVRRDPEMLIVSLLLVAWLGITYSPDCFYAVYFILGAACSNLVPGSHWFALAISRRLQSAIPQWLGKVSYALYLIHWPILLAAKLAFGKVGVLVAAPLTLPAAWLAWRFIDRPAIELSRNLGRFLKRTTT